MEYARKYDNSQLFLSFIPDGCIIMMFYAFFSEQFLQVFAQ